MVNVSKGVVTALVLVLVAEAPSRRRIQRSFCACFKQYHDAELTPIAGA